MPNGSLDRTYEELKLLWIAEQFGVVQFGLDRTYEELKQQVQRVDEHRKRRLDRTYEELKHDKAGAKSEEPAPQFGSYL